MTKEIYILGVGMHAWGKWGRPFHDYAGVAARAAVLDAGVTLRDIEFLSAAGTVRCGYEGHVAGCTVARELGLHDVESVTSYGACTSGALALAVARDRILAGKCRIALVVGADIAIPTSKDLGSTGMIDADATQVTQLGSPAYLGVRATRRMHECGTTVEDLHKVRVKNSEHGLRNPYARFRQRLSPRYIEASPMVATPLRLLHLSTFSDGAAAVVLADAEVARASCTPRIELRAISLSNLTDADLEVPQWSAQLPSAGTPGRRQNVERSLSAAGVASTDLSIVELYDVSPVSELDWYEHIGLCKSGEAEELLRSGATSLGGKMPVNVSGGLTSFGESVAAQALAQTCELTWQLRGECGPRQVAGARVGLAICDGIYGHVASVLLTA